MRSICVMSGKAIRHARFNTGWAKEMEKLGIPR